jgi:hypothetical protein
MSEDNVTPVLLKYARAAEKITRILLPKIGNQNDKFNEDEVMQIVKNWQTSIVCPYKEFRSYEDYVNDAVLAMYLGTGNCDQNAAISFFYLWSKLDKINAKIRSRNNNNNNSCELYKISGSGHTYCILKYGDVGVICDPWAEVVALCKFKTETIDSITDDDEGCIKMHRTVLQGGVEWFKTTYPYSHKLKAEGLYKDKWNFLYVANRYYDEISKKIDSHIESKLSIEDLNNLNRPSQYNSAPNVNRRGSYASAVSTNSAYTARDYLLIQTAPITQKYYLNRMALRIKLCTEEVIMTDNSMDWD